MDSTQRYVIEAYMNALYDGKPEGELLSSIRSFEERLIEYGETHPRAADIMGESGMREEYNQLYMAVINRNYGYSTSSGDDKPEAFDYSKAQRIPTVHEFLDTYRVVYENAVKPNKRELTDKAYQKLFDVENRTDDIMEAQLIIEREKLILNTVTADYKDIAEDFLEAADPNYEVTSAGVKATIGTYATATSLEEITYMGELAKATCDDIAVQTQLKVEVMTNLMSLIFAWERAKRKIREGDPKLESYVKAMVLTRRQLRKYYRFMAEDMGITFDVIEASPFYTISLLNPQGLDELWRIKKVMHPDNIKAMRYVLFEEVLTDKSMEEILLTPQPYPYYEMVDTRRCPDMDDEFNAIAEELNKDIRYFQRNRTPDGRPGKSELIKNTSRLKRTFADSAGRAPAASSMPGSTGMMKNLSSAGSGLKSMVSGMDKGMKREIGKETAKSVAAEAAKEVGKGLLRSLFRR